VRDATGDYAGAFWGAGALCLAAAVFSVLVGRRGGGPPAVAPPAPAHAPDSPAPVPR